MNDPARITERIDALRAEYEPDQEDGEGPWVVITVDDMSVQLHRFTFSFQAQSFLQEYLGQAYGDHTEADIAVIENTDTAKRYNIETQFWMVPA